MCKTNYVKRNKTLSQLKKQGLGCGVELQKKFTQKPCQEEWKSRERTKLGHQNKKQMKGNLPSTCIVWSAAVRKGNG